DRLLVPPRHHWWTDSERTRKGGPRVHPVLLRHPGQRDPRRGATGMARPHAPAGRAGAGSAHMAVSLHAEPGHVPFTVTATLRSGAGWDRPYGLDLAGILAAHLRRVEKARLEQDDQLVATPPEDTTDAVAIDLDLPLARCTTGPDWHWAATCAIPVAAEDDPETHMFYRTTDSSWSERAATRPLPYFSPKSGPYRDVMVP